MDMFPIAETILSNRVQDGRAGGVQLNGRVLPPVYEALGSNPSGTKKKKDGRLLLAGSRVYSIYFTRHWEHISDHSHTEPCHQG